MTYTDRVNILAEKMAKKSCGALYAPDMIEHYIPLAEIALEDTADIVEQLLIDAFYSEDKQEYIKSLGLVPDKK